MLSFSLALKASYRDQPLPANRRKRETNIRVNAQKWVINHLFFFLSYEFNTPKQTGTSLRTGPGPFPCSPNPPPQHGEPHSEAGCASPGQNPILIFASCLCAGLNFIMKPHQCMHWWATAWDPEWARQSPATCSTWSTVQFPGLSPGCLAAPRHPASWPG